MNLENTRSSQAQTANEHFKYSDNTVIIHTSFGMKEIYSAPFTV